jgi:hypothetical protein
MLPAPTAGPMVARMRDLPAELTAGERRVAPILRYDVVPRAYTHCLSSRPLCPEGNPTLPAPCDAGYDHTWLSGGASPRCDWPSSG